MISINSFSRSDVIFTNGDDCFRTTSWASVTLDAGPSKSVDVVLIAESVESVELLVVNDEDVGEVASEFDDVVVASWLYNTSKNLFYFNFWINK